MILSVHGSNIYVAFSQNLMDFIATVTVTHTVRAEGKKPSQFLQSFLKEYRATPHGSTGRSPNYLMLGTHLQKSGVSDLYNFKPQKTDGD